MLVEQVLGLTQHSIHFPCRLPQQHLLLIWHLARLLENQIKKKLWKKREIRMHKNRTEQEERNLHDTERRE
jgi:hypothetical protein